VSRNATERKRPADLQQKIRQFEDLNDSSIRRFAFDLVSHYRRHEQDQEWIAIALTDKATCSGSARVKQRVREILAMLDHVHDPFITSN
jgi:hypothetical protein